MIVHLTMDLSERVCPFNQLIPIHFHQHSLHLQFIRSRLFTAFVRSPPNNPSEEDPLLNGPASLADSKRDWTTTIESSFTPIVVCY